MHLFNYVNTFTSFFGHYIEQNICFYSLKASLFIRSSHWEIFCKITVLHVSAKQIKICLWKCFVFIKVGGCRYVTLVELDFFHWHFLKILIVKSAWHSIEQLFWRISRSSRPKLFCKKGVYKNFTKFIGKFLCQILFFNKVPGWGLQLYSGTV